MQKVRIIQNPKFSGITNLDTIISTGESLSFSNNYYSYITKNGGELVNDNNIKDFLDKPENSQLAEDFVSYLQENTNILEFKEIFYDNKKLSNTFNEFYKNNYVQNFNEKVSIKQSLNQTSGHTTFETNFNTNNERLNNKQIDLLNPTLNPLDDSYFINLKIDHQKKTISSINNSKYFKDCIKESYIDKAYYFINNVDINIIYANIPYILKNKNKNFNFGYSPIQNIDFNNLNTPIIPGQGRTGFNFDFFDYSQFVQNFNYQPEQLLNNKPGTFISQYRFIINNTNTFSVSEDSYYNQGNLNYSAQFETHQLIEFEKNIYSSITIPFTVSLNQPSIGNTYLYVQAEKYSTAVLGYNFFTNPQLIPYNQKSIVISNGTNTTTDYLTITDKILPEDTIILTLRNASNIVIGFLIIRCEEFIETKQYKDNSYLFVKNIFKNKVFLNCFVDYNYNVDDMEFYRNNDIKIVKIPNSPLDNSADKIINQNISSKFDIKRIVKLSKLNEKDIKNIFFIGSKVYGTDNFNSDMDFTIVADTDISEQVFSDELYQIKILSISKYNSDLANAEFPTIEFRFLPEYAKIKQLLTSEPPINYQRLYNSVESKINFNMNLIRSYFKSKNNDYIINKLIFHCFRIIKFSIEIVKTGSINDFTIANIYYDFGSKYNFNSFDDLENIITPKLNELKNELKMAISNSTN